MWTENILSVFAAKVAFSNLSSLVLISVDVAHFLKYFANIEFKIFSLISVIHLFYSNYFVNYALPVILT